jgi:hypothetical protein
MKNLIGNNSDKIPWTNIIRNLGEGKSKTLDNPDHLYDEKGFSEILSLWKTAGYYENNSAQWINYYPGTNFDDEITRLFSNFVGVDSVRSWISRVNPGRTAPWHWDADDNISEYEEKGELVRFSCHIGDSEPGHIFILENDIFHHENSGNTYKWDKWNQWHAGINLGWNAKYMYNFLGYR